MMATGKYKLVWPNESINELIDLVQEKSVVWDIKSKEYYDKDKRRLAVMGICERLNISEDEFKRKWNTIRTQYTQEKVKVEKSRKSGAGTDDIYVPKWTWYDRLGFLADVTGPKRTLSNLPLPDEIEEANTLHEERQDLDDVESEESLSLNSLNQKDGEVFVRKSGSTPNRKRAAQNEELKMLERATSLLETIKKTNVIAEDELDTFGKYVASELRLIKNPVMLRMAKFKINNILFESQNENTTSGTNTAAECQKIQYNSAIHNSNQQPFLG